jgi:AcrR family transcriptional regulator
MNQFCDLARARAGIPDVALRYLNSLTFVMVHRQDAGGRFSGDWKSAWKSGFASGGLTGRPDFDRMLTDASMVDYSAFGRDTLMTAVFETVMEEAGSDISLDRVAKKAGITKSSLYNYWPGKEAMLRDVLNRQALLFIDLFGQFADRYARPEDRIFAYLAFVGAFLRRTPEVLNYLQRMMSHGIHMPREGNSVDPRFIEPLNAVLDSGMLSLKGFEPFDFLGLMNLAGVNEIKHHLSRQSSRIRIEQSLKDLYLLITGGIPALRRTM